MARMNLDLEQLIDAGALRATLTALTDARGGDGSSFSIRAEVLKVLKQASKDGRQKAQEQLVKDGDGTACARRISHVQDEIIRVIHDFAVTHVYRSHNASSAERIAVSAVGGYGRGTLAPGSDIDLLFILPYKQTAWGEQVIEYILYMLWDMGFKVGHATRNIDECIRLSREDMTIRTSVLEVRYIHGTKELYDTLSERFSKEVVEETASEFISAKLAERDARHSKAGESRYLVEPNVKDGKGGLRDLHTFFWIGKYFYNIARSHELVKVGLYTEREYQRFRRAEKFLWTVRCHMHFLTGKAEERLNFDIQREMAARLNYKSHHGLSGVERFMKHYFLVAKEVGELTLIACAKLEEKDAKKVSGINRFLRSFSRRTKKIKGYPDFIQDNGRINFTNKDIFTRDPINLLRLFKISDKTGLDFHPDIMELLTKSLKRVDRNLRNNKEANAIFLEILCSENGPERLLRRMNESGLLGKFIPAFGRIVSMMQFNMYHHYTVDEHLLQSVGTLWGIESGKLAEEHPLSIELWPDIEDRTILYVALFLHDIAKGRKEDHSIAGARLAKVLCPRLGLNEEQTELVSWLIREHLTMSTVAQGRDLADPKTIQDFSEVVQEVSRMRYLLVLTVCDIRAVGPGVWNGWKGQLLRTLYHETELFLNGGFSRTPMKARVEQAKEILATSLEGWSEEDIEAVANLPYSAYYLSTDTDTQVRHMHLLRDMRQNGTSLATDVHTKAFEAITEITVVAPDHPRLLSIITGACSAAGGNIVDAKIHTTTDGMALDSIFITRQYSGDEDEKRRAARIGKMIEEVLSGVTTLPEIIARNISRNQRFKAFSIAPKVEINNTLSNTFSVIEIECLDRPGLLSELTRKLADLNLDIGSAHIITFGEKANDSFYVRDLIGHKIEDEKHIKRIKSELIEVMQPTKTENKNQTQAAVQ